MKQSRVDSFLEVAISIFIGAIFALVAQLIWYPIIGKQFTMSENLITTAFFTLISFLRSYLIRRLFNDKSVYQALKSRLVKNDI